MKIKLPIIISLLLTSAMSVADGNTAFGTDANVGTGNDNTSIGNAANQSITTGSSNTSLGKNAGATNEVRSNNTMIGTNAGASIDHLEELYYDNRADDNTFIGAFSGSSNRYGTDNVFVGYFSGNANDATDNTFLGSEAGLFNTTGTDNTFIGEESGQNNTTGSKNTFVGEDAGFSSITSRNNVAVGRSALRNITEGKYNTAVGREAGVDISTGNRNTALGQSAGKDIGVGTANTMLGENAGPNTEHADFNTFVGFQAGFDNNRTNHTNDANRNTALGAYAGYTNREGEDNVWVGTLADSAEWFFDNDGEVSFLQSNAGWDPTFGASSHTNLNYAVSRTTVLGNNASVLKNDAIGIGYSSKVDGLGSIAIGTNAITSHPNSITIGYGASSKAQDTVVIGNDSTVALTANIDATTDLGHPTYRFKNIFSNKASVNATSGNNAQIDLLADAGNANDDLWSIKAADGGDFTISSFATGSHVNILSINNNGNVTIAGNLTVNSDRRLKQNIKPIKSALGLLSKIEGVTYFWKPELKREQQKQYGVIAQNIEAVIPELVITSKEDVKSVNYQALLPVLVNGINEQQAQINKQQQNINKMIKFLSKG